MAGALALPAAAEDPLEQQARDIAKGLLCPVCQGLTVADSPSQLAQQMRAIIRQKLERGESQDQIVQYFVERYGEGVLVEPPKSGFRILLWLGPVLALGAGVGLLVWVLRMLLRQRVPGSASALSAPEASLEREIRQWQGEGPP